MDRSGTIQQSRWWSAALLLATLTLAACGGSSGGGGSGGGNTGGGGSGGGGSGGGGNGGAVSGTVSYEFVPPNGVCSGLDFAATVPRPIRGATVLLLNSGGAEVARTVSDAQGGYRFDDVALNSTMRLRVLAELKPAAGSPTWDVEVRDNYDPAGSQPLASRPKYAVDSDTFNTGSEGIEVSLRAQTGWVAGSYSGVRTAAPFAVLDTIYTVMQFVHDTDPGVTFPPLDVFWSTRNSLDTSADLFDGIDSGALGASFYVSTIDSLFLVGDAVGDDNGTYPADTEEFDDHVIAHEWGHYFEDSFSRSDSVGGPHGIGDRLDARLAFGEGWATAFAAMALDDPIYCDTGPPGSLAGFAIGAEDGSYDPRGWYDEISVLRFIYDMFDATDNGGQEVDDVAIGFGPIYDVMTGPQRTTEAFATIFSFASYLHDSLGPGEQDALIAQLAREDMSTGGLPLDIWGTNETNDADGRPNVRPLYADFVADGSPQQVCVDSQFDQLRDPNTNQLFRDGNKLSEFRYLRVQVDNTSRYRITVNTLNPPSTPPPGYDCTTAPSTDPNIHRHSDPDVGLYRNGNEALPFPEGLSCEPNQEVADTVQLSPGTYMLDVTEYRFADPESPFDFPTAGSTEICFNVSMQAIN